MKNVKWLYDEKANRTYNVAGAFELMLIKLNITKIDNQWDIDLLDAYSIDFEKQQKIRNEYRGNLDDLKLKYEVSK